jgi:RNA polymerase sigma factor for flagellar operon FliA
MDSGQADGTTEHLWRSYKESGDQEARNRLVLQYSPLVKYVAGRVRSGLPASVDQNDLISDGVIGLMDAIDKFDHERGLQFQTYAVPRIRGAIVDGLRASDWVPRSVREKIRDIDAAQAKLERQLGRAPDDREVARELGVTTEDLRTTYGKIAYTNVASIDEMSFGDDSEPAGGRHTFADGDDVPDGFLAAVHELPERDRVVVALYYWEGLTLAEIGQALGVTESRISQLHSRATMTLRRKLVDRAA